MVPDPFVSMLRALFRGQSAEWPGDVSEAQFLSTLERHGIEALTYRAAFEQGVLARWPEGMVAALRRTAQLHAAMEATSSTELRRVLTLLAEQRIFPILIKGAALAYTHYPSPELRPRTDTDLLIRHSDLEAISRIMAGQGYRPTTANTDAMNQLTLERVDRHGFNHQYDFHWKVSNARHFSELISFEEAEAIAVPVSRLGPHARTLPAVESLLLALIHRVAHHYGSDRLIWLYDIHLLIERMSAGETERFWRLAEERKMRSVCSDGVNLAQHWFATVSYREPRTEDRKPKKEPSAGYLRPGRRRVHQFLADFNAEGDWRARLRFLRRNAFPSKAFIMKSYGARSPLLFPFLFLHRSIRGLARLLMSLQ